MKILSLTLPNPDSSKPSIEVGAPSGVPTGGLGTGEAGTNLIQVAVQFIFIIGFVLAVAFIIISGIQMIVSGGDKQKVQAVRARLTYSIIGLVVIVGAFFIVSTVISLFGGTPSFFFPAF